MDEHITDYQLQGFYKRKLRESRYAYAKKLNSQIWCAVRLIKAPMHMPGVFLLTNGDSSKIWGVQSCDSPWSCPVCSAKRMAHEAGRIASAIDALEKQFNEEAFMITLSVPHYHDFTCKQVYDILRETWKQFVHHAKSKTQQDVFAQMACDLECKHRIRVGEFTWGHYGWHPHYHCLFFVKKGKLQRALDWQDKLAARWVHLTKKSTIKVLTRDKYRDMTKEEVKEFVNEFFTKTNYAKGHPEAVISLDEKGKVRRAKSSEYMCGWGADKELTGNVRKEASHTGHYTPHQILLKAYELYKKGETEECDKWFSLYVEYALATFKTYRVRMSPDLKKIIENWRLTNDYIECFKKKSTQEMEKTAWKVVCWFNEQQWFAICTAEILPQIIHLAREPDARKRISELLAEIGADSNLAEKAPQEEWFVKNMFNVA